MRTRKASCHESIGMVDAMPLACCGAVQSVFVAGIATFLTRHPSWAFA